MLAMRAGYRSLSFVRLLMAYTNVVIQVWLVDHLYVAIH